jgi:hypothetical protein
MQVPAPAPVLQAQLSIQADRAGQQLLARATREWFIAAVQTLGAPLWQELNDRAVAPAEMPEWWGGQPGDVWAECCAYFGSRSDWSPYSARDWEALLEAIDGPSVILAFTLYRLAALMPGRLHPGFPRLGLSARYVDLPAYNWWGLKLQASADLLADADRERQLLQLVRSVADTGNPAYGEISFDNTGLLDFDTSYEHNVGLYPWNAVRRATRNPRGYSWLTILAEPVGNRLGGEAALRDSGAFVEVARLVGGGYWLLATSRLAEYDLDAADRVRTVLAPVLYNRRARPDEPGELPHLLSTAGTGRGPTRRAIPDEVFDNRIDVRDRSHHRVAVAVRALGLHRRYPAALIGQTTDLDGPDLVCWGAEPGEVWIWQFLPEDDPYAGFEIPRAPGRGWWIVRDDRRSAGLRVRLGPSFAELGLPADQTGIDHLGGREITVFDAVPGLQLYYGEEHTTNPALILGDLTTQANQLYRAANEARPARGKPSGSLSRQ